MDLSPKLGGYLYYTERQQKCHPVFGRFWGRNGLQEVDKGALLTVEKFLEGVFIGKNGGFCPETWG